jgi:hypothetical protein
MLMRSFASSVESSLQEIPGATTFHSGSPAQRSSGSREGSSPASAAIARGSARSAYSTTRSARSQPAFDVAVMTVSVSKLGEECGLNRFSFFWVNASCTKEGRRRASMASVGPSNCSASWSCG